MAAATRPAARRRGAARQTTRPKRAHMAALSMDDASLTAEGVVARLDPGSGVAVQFREMNREGRERMFKILEFVQKTTTFYNNRYLDSLTKS